MQVLKALCVQKRTTPRRGPSLVHESMLYFAVVQQLWVDRPWHPMLWRTLVHRLLDKTQEGKLLHKRKLIFHVLWPPKDRNESITVFIGFHFFTFLYFFGVAFYTLLAFLSIDSEIARTEPKYGHCDATCNNAIKPVKLHRHRPQIEKVGTDGFQRGNQRLPWQGTAGSQTLKLRVPNLGTRGYHCKELPVPRS